MERSGPRPGLRRPRRSGLCDVPPGRRTSPGIAQRGALPRHGWVSRAALIAARRRERALARGAGRSRCRRSRPRSPLPPPRRPSRPWSHRPPPPRLTMRLPTRSRSRPRPMPTPKPASGATPSLLGWTQPIGPATRVEMPDNRDPAPDHPPRRRGGDRQEHVRVRVRRRHRRRRLRTHVPRRGDVRDRPRHPGRHVPA